jgi:hypothetical protein
MYERLEIQAKEHQAKETEMETYNADRERADGWRYLILDREGKVLDRYKNGTRFQWDFTLPGPTKGGRAVDLHA